MEFGHAKGRTVVILALAVMCVPDFFSVHVNGAGPPRPSLTLVDRAIGQDQGAWVIEYRLRNVAGAGLIVTPEDIRLKVQGWVSNSRVASHAVPRWSSVIITPVVDPTASSEVINAVDESQRCRERLAISVWGEGRPRLGSSSAVRSVEPPPALASPAAGLALLPLAPISLGPGEKMHLRLRIDHQHTLYGDYDPLLGVRTIEMTLGKSIVRDTLPLDREQYLAQPKYTWPEPPEERRDTRHFVSAPDSLHLEADVQGHQSYRYQEQPRALQHQDEVAILVPNRRRHRRRVPGAPRAKQRHATRLRPLHEAAFEERLKTIGRWTKYELIVQTEPEATRLILEFKIVGEIDIGEMWIDDVNLEPLSNTGPGGP